MNITFKFAKIIRLIFTTVIFTGLCTSHTAYGQNDQSVLPKEKQTTPGLYVTAKEAYDKWKSNPDKVKILDVRTTEEYLYIGHAAMAWSIPAFLQTYTWDAEKQQYKMKPNPNFITQTNSVFKPGDTILVTCRSGGRSALAVNQLAAAGFKQVFNITDGMEGDTIDDPQSLFNGQHLKNGWKNSGCPWTYKLVPDLILIPTEKTTNQ
jgi:rhodanese-related sulfurtransferase